MLRSLAIPLLDRGDFFGQTEVATRCSCGGDHPVEFRLALTSLRATKLAVLKAVGEDDDEDDDTDEGETGGDAWKHLEIALLALIMSFYWKHAKKVLPEVKPYFTATGANGTSGDLSHGLAFDSDGFHATASAADQELRDALAHDQAELEAQIRQTVSAGEAEIQAGITAHNNAIDRAVTNLTSSTMHYVDEFFMAHVIPAVDREVRAALADGPLARPNLTPIFDALEQRLAGDAYFSLVANATASRAFHYGYLKAASAQGYQVVVFDAVIDTRTTDICRHLNGTTWQLADMLDKYERAVAAQDTEELKEAAPWFSRDKDVPIKEDVDDFIAQGGVPTPPLHGHCRSTLRVM